MKSSLFYLSLPVVLTGLASAQVLPAPAPIPKPISAPTRAKVAPAAAPDLLQAPLPSDEPLIIGEPVRKQIGSARARLAPQRLAPQRLAPQRLAPQRLAPQRLAPQRLAPQRLAPQRLAPQRLAPQRLAPQRLAPRSRASVAGVSLVGLSDGPAVAKMRAALAPSLKEPVRLVIGGYQYTFLREELGADLPLWPLMRQARAQNSDVPLRLQVSQPKLVAALQELDSQVRADFEKTALNVGGSATRIKLALESAPLPGAVTLLTTPLKTDEIAPKTPTDAIKTEETTSIAAPGQFPFLLARFSTRYDAGLRGRTTNLKMAAKLIDGTVVAPGKTFSTNAAIGPRNAAAGWREAKMFVSGRVVSGTGAGICQAASTLYNAALLGNFPIVERHAHSMRVMYVPPSRDAALMWGSKDFKFRNTSGGAMKVKTSVSGGQFHVQMWGQAPGERAPVRIVTRVLSRAGGTKSEAFKIIGDQKIRLSRDSYKPHP